MISELDNFNEPAELFGYIKGLATQIKRLSESVMSIYNVGQIAEYANEIIKAEEKLFIIYAAEKQLSDD